MSGACSQCARREWLLEKLGSCLDFRARELSRFWSLLQLPDLELIQALGGRRREDLHAAYAHWEPIGAQSGEQLRTICRHNSAYPWSLREDPLAPHTLSVRANIEPLAHMLEKKLVAIVGTCRASDYGMETARELARGLAAAGVTVASGLAEGIPSAVHRGALEAGGKTLTVIAGHPERGSPAFCRALYRRIVNQGCAISEVRGECPRPRGWWQPARARTIALLAQLVIVVEAGEHPWELACAHVAQARGTGVAAVPGRVSSPASRGTNSLLMSGARLVRDPHDALDVLYGAGAPSADTAIDTIELEPWLATVLERVGDGEDTWERLATGEAKAAKVAVALAELELLGLLVRGEGGRYVPSAAASFSRARRHPGYRRFPPPMS